MSVSINPPKTPVTEGSSGIAAATLPNVCKMPGPPAPFVPTPLPNIGKSDNSPQGYSTSVTIGGKAVAIQGATFNSMGDVASQGTGGGLVSNNVQGPTSFAAPGSLDVKIEGKNVQLLGDQMLNNGGPSGSPANSATMAGVIQAPGMPVLMLGVNLTEIAKACNEQVNEDAGYPPGKPSGRECSALGSRKHKCCRDAIDKANNPNVKAEQCFTKAGEPATYPGQLRPDIVVLDASGKVSKVFDFKFNCSDKAKMSNRQTINYKRTFKVVPQIIHAW